MKKLIILVVSGSFFAVTPLVAQHPGHSTASTQNAVEKFAGQWEGSFATDHSPPGVLRVTIARDSSTIEVIMDRPVAFERLTDIKLDGNKVSWSHGFMGGTCKSIGVHESGTIKGDVTCDHGAYTFTLTKK